MAPDVGDDVQDILPEQRLSAGQGQMRAVGLGEEFIDETEEIARIELRLVVPTTPPLPDVVAEGAVLVAFLGHFERNHRRSKPYELQY